MIHGFNWLPIQEEMPTVPGQPLETRGGNLELELVDDSVIVFGAYTPED